MAAIISRTLFLFVEFMALLIAMIGLGTMICLLTYYTLIFI